MSQITLFTGNANLNLSESIASHLNLPLGKATVGKFSDGETMAEIHENVRGKSVYIIQPTCAPTNDNLMELIILADALRRASVYRITAVIPYFGYARQDRRVYSARVPISAKVVTNMLESVGIHRVLTVDLHADQIQGFFQIPVDNIYGTPELIKYIQTQGTHNLTVVSPDIGGVVRARAVAKRLNDADLAIIDKRRPKPNQVEVMNIIGDIKDRHCLLVDDIVDTAGTLTHAANALKHNGAASVKAYITHPVLSGNAIANIENSELDELVVTDTIPLHPQAQKCAKIRVISLGAVIAEAIYRISESESISSMFTD